MLGEYGSPKLDATIAEEIGGRWTVKRVEAVLEYMQRLSMVKRAYSGEGCYWSLSEIGAHMYNRMRIVEASRKLGLRG